MPESEPSDAAYCALLVCAAGMHSQYLDQGLIHEQAKLHHGNTFDLCSMWLLTFICITDKRLTLKCGTWHTCLGACRPNLL